jgi:hypothetical protein
MDVEHKPVSRRRAMSRLGQWSLGVAALVSGVALRGRPAAAAVLPGGCCDLFYTRYCTALEWSQQCGTCQPDTSNLGYPTGKWWWSCYVAPGRQRLCGECFYLECSYTFTFRGKAAACNGVGDMRVAP